MKGLFKYFISLRLLVLIFLLGFLFILPKNIYATSVTIVGAPSVITNNPFEVKVYVAGGDAGINYLRGNFYKADTTSYFGYTFNGYQFVNSSDFSTFLPVTMDSSGNWSGQVQLKLDPTSKFYKGPGSYNIKVRRYTPSGSYIWSNETSLNVDIPLATLAPQSTPGPIEEASTAPISSPSSNKPVSEFKVSLTPTAISSNQSFIANVKLSLPNNPNSKFYLKGAFVKSGGSNYLGLTKVSNGWVKNGSTYSQQKDITTDASGNYEGSIEVQPDSEDSGFIGSGDYIFKVGRYTSGGSGPTWSNDNTLIINSVALPSTNTKTTTTSEVAPKVDIFAPASTNTKVTLAKTSNKPKIDYQIPDELLASNINKESSEGGTASVAGSLIESSEEPSSKNNLFYLISGASIIGLGIIIVTGYLVRKRFTNDL